MKAKTASDKYRKRYSHFDEVFVQFDGLCFLNNRYLSSLYGTQPFILCNLHFITVKSACFLL